MAKAQKSTPKGRKNNPLGGVAKKPASYVGDLDDLLGQIADDHEAAPERPTRSPERRGRGEAPSDEQETTKEEMKIDSSDEGSAVRSRVNLLLPAHLHRRFKAKAATEGVTMTSVLESFIRGYVGE